MFNFGFVVGLISTQIRLAVVTLLKNFVFFSPLDLTGAVY